ncbi:MAG: hypothetical protein KKB51_12660 [Candidatus Riflebacteria bacterium]|nr:hypothetical protein [Candidatus Riflebacteria bacterium]
MPKVHRKKYSDNLYIKARFKNQIITWQLTYEGEQLLKRFGLDGDKTEISRATAIAFRRANYLYTENSGLSADSISPEIEPDGKNPISKSESELLKALRRAEIGKSSASNRNTGVISLKEPEKKIAKPAGVTKKPLKIIRLGQTTSENHVLHDKTPHGKTHKRSESSENKSETPIDSVVREMKVGLHRTVCPVCKATVKNSRFVSHLTKVHSMYVETIKQGYISYSHMPIKRDLETKPVLPPVVTEQVKKKEKAKESTVKAKLVKTVPKPVEKKPLAKTRPIVEKYSAASESVFISPKPPEFLCPICNKDFPARKLSQHIKLEHDFEVTDGMIAEAIVPGEPKTTDKEFYFRLSQLTTLPEMKPHKFNFLKKASFLGHEGAIEKLLYSFLMGEEEISPELLHSACANNVISRQNKTLFDKSCLSLYQNNAVNYKKMISQQSISIEEAEAYYNYLKLFQSYLLLLFWHIGLLKSAYEKAVVTFILAARELKFSDYQRAYSSITKNDYFGIWAPQSKSWLKIFASYGDEKVQMLVEQLKASSKCGFGSEG